MQAGLFSVYLLIPFCFLNHMSKVYYIFFFLPFLKEDNAFLTINRNLRVGKRTCLVVQQLRI